MIWRTKENPPRNGYYLVTIKRRNQKQVSRCRFSFFHDYWDTHHPVIAWGAGFIREMNHFDYIKSGSNSPTSLRYRPFDTSESAETKELLAEFIEAAGYKQAFAQLENDCREFFSSDKIQFSLESVPDSDTPIPLISVRVATVQPFDDFRAARKRLFRMLRKNGHNQFCELLAIVRGWEGKNEAKLPLPEYAIRKKKAWPNQELHAWPPVTENITYDVVEESTGCGARGGFGC